MTEQTDTLREQVAAAIYAAAEWVDPDDRAMVADAVLAVIRPVVDALTERYAFQVAHAGTMQDRWQKAEAEVAALREQIEPFADALAQMSSNLRAALGVTE